MAISVLTSGGKNPKGNLALSSGTTDQTGINVIDYATVSISKIASGSATTPATTITQSQPSFTKKGNTVTASVAQKTQSVTPTVSAGYVSSGTAGTITLGSNSNTYTIPTETKSVTVNGTVTPTSGKYLTSVSVNVPNSYTLQIITDTGSTVVASKSGSSSVTLTETSTGVYTGVVGSAGTWTVTATKSGMQASTSIVTTSTYSEILAYKAKAYTSAQSGITYTEGLPSDWAIMKEVAQAISDASSTISASTTSAIYVDKGNTYAYKITPGNTISISMNGTNYSYAVMGFNNYQLTNTAWYGGSNTYAGLTLGTVDCHATTAKMNSSNTNAGGWGGATPSGLTTGCLMRTSTMQTLKGYMPAACQSNMAQVQIPYYNYGGSSMLYASDYMFLPAEKEIFGSRSCSPTGEANSLTQYAYYINGGSKIKKVSGSASYWWERSVHSDISSHFCAVTTSGSAGISSASNTNGVAPCFCV